jgi:hypothetical protein
VFRPRPRGLLIGENEHADVVVYASAADGGEQLANPTSSRFRHAYLAELQATSDVGLAKGWSRTLGRRCGSSTQLLLCSSRSSNSSRAAMCSFHSRYHQAHELFNTHIWMNIGIYMASATVPAEES